MYKHAGYAHCDECHKQADVYAVKILTKRRKGSGISVQRNKYLCEQCLVIHKNLDHTSYDLYRLIFLFKDMSQDDIRQALNVIAPDIA